MVFSKSSIPHRLDLHSGDWVTVRSKEEILSTLDKNATLDSLPFQPEMFSYCGQKLQVVSTAHKTCDTIKKTGGRRMNNAVHLRDIRCDGSQHGECQADCLFFWKEAWLKRANAPAIENDYTLTEASCTEEDVQKGAFVNGASGGETVWICQTTALYDATSPLKWWDIRQYIKDVSSGNHSAWHMFKLILDASYHNLVRLGYGYRMLIAMYNLFKKLIGGKPFPIGEGTIPKGKPTPAESLDLQPGEWVEVKSPDEIRNTLNVDGVNRGMRFDIEMLKYAGKQYKVEMRVNRLIDEVTGKMLTMKTPCIQLDDVYCRAECTPMRLGCPRASNTYWREIWLKRVDGPK